jgi:hypothetical protein
MRKLVSLLVRRRGCLRRDFASTCEHFWYGEFCAELKFSRSNQLVPNQAAEIELTAIFVERNEKMLKLSFGGILKCAR